MVFKIGSISVKCKSCQSVTVIDNDQLHGMKEFRCKECGTRMPDYERAGMMMNFNCLVYEKIQRVLGDAEKLFDYEIDFFPHYEVNATDTGDG